MVEGGGGGGGEKEEANQNPRNKVKVNYVTKKQTEKNT